MFTGIIEETGRIESIEHGEASIKLSIHTRLCGKDARLGDSIAVNGCCLTVAARKAERDGVVLQFDLLQETWRRTSFQKTREGEFVNLERSLQPTGRMGGHFVTGHIDGIGRIKRWERSGADHLLDLHAPAEVMRYVVAKGSIAVDGISLTVTNPSLKGLRLWIIPHTFEVTNLREKSVGDLVNLEGDLIGKYVEKFFVEAQKTQKPTAPKKKKGG